MFRNREEAAKRLAAELRGLELHNPLLLAIPRGGVVTGAVLARQLGGDLDVVLSRKLRAPGQPELAIGAISEDGQVHLNRAAAEALQVDQGYLEHEKGHQLSEISRRKRLFRSVRPKAPISGRSVIVTDDGIATGSTMMAALETVRPQQPLQLIVAIPVAPLDRLPALERRCDKLVCLRSPADVNSTESFRLSKMKTSSSCSGNSRRSPPRNPIRTLGGLAMAVDTVNVFEHTIEITHIWLHDLMDRLGWQDKHRAYLALRAVLHALRDRITVDDASHLAAQLPMLIRGFYYEGYHPAGKPVADRKQVDFLARVATECVDESRYDGKVTRAVFQVLSQHIASGEVDKIKGCLPSDIRELWD